MIQEATIESVLARLERGQDDFAIEIQDFARAQPELMSYLTNEEIEAFTDAEREFLLFGAVVIYQSITDERTEPAPVSGSAIAEAEEANYLLIDEGSKTFRDRITPAFEQSTEEDLLAFVEDMLIDVSEGDSITREAREPLFVTLKTVVDVLTA